MANLHQSLRNRFLSRWRKFWLVRSGPTGFGRLAARFACAGIAPYHHRSVLSQQTARGFVDPDASVNHSGLELGRHVLIGRNVIISRNHDGGPVQLDDRVQLYGDSFLDTGSGGAIRIGSDTHIQPGCHIHAYVSEIQIGCKVEIAANCAFYSYDHGMKPGSPIMQQPLTSKGPVRVGDGVWIGHGAIILHGVTIGEGAVVAAGAVVVKDVPANSIAAGVPAKVIGHRVSAVGNPAIRESYSLAGKAAPAPSSGAVKMELTPTP